MAMARSDLIGAHTLDPLGQTLQGELIALQDQAHAIAAVAHTGLIGTLTKEGAAVAPLDQRGLGVIALQHDDSLGATEVAVADGVVLPPGGLERFG